MRAEGIYRYSFNELYRLNTETAEIEHRERKNRGEWKRISDYHRVTKMPKAIKEDFNRVLVVIQSFNLGSHSAQGGSDTARGGSDNAQGDSQRLSEGTPRQGL